jgi:N-acyl-phosphatidylethanolamine-hydrolysing phospholipase D
MAVRFLRRFFTASSRPPAARTFGHTPRFSSPVKMSSIGGAALGGAGLYAAVSSPAQLGAKPEEADLKAHHLKNGKGFVNPWDSYKDLRPWEIMWGMIS